MVLTNACRGGIVPRKHAGHILCWYSRSGGVYSGLMDKFPIGSLMNRSLTVKSGQCHVHRDTKPLLERIEKGEIDPTFIITHRMKLEDAPVGYETFMHKDEECMKVVLKT